jgi:hypothetical protein
MNNPECRGCGITPSDVPDGFEEQFEDGYENGLCPACQLQPAGTWTAERVDMGEGAAVDDDEDIQPLFCGMPCLGECEEVCPYNEDSEEDL